MVGSLVLRQSHFHRGIGIGPDQDQDQDQDGSSFFYSSETADDDSVNDLADRSAVRSAVIKH